MSSLNKEGVEDLGRLLRDAGVDELSIGTLKGQGIAGRHLVNLSEKDLQDIGLNKGARLDILHFVEKYKQGFIHDVNSVQQASNSNIILPEFSSEEPIFQDLDDYSRLGPLQSSLLCLGEGDQSCYDGFNNPGLNNDAIDSSSLSTSGWEDSFSFQNAISISMENAGIRQVRQVPQRTQVAGSSDSTRAVDWGPSCSTAAESTPQTTSNERILTRSTAQRVPVSSCTSAALSTPQSNNIGRFRTRSTAQRVPVSSCTSTAQSMPQSTAAPFLPEAQDATLFPDLNSDDRMKQLIMDGVAKSEYGFNIDDILENHRNGNIFVQELFNNGFLATKKLKPITNILLTYINNNRRSNTSTVAMREEMAIAFVARFPKMVRKLYKPTDMPWHHLYNCKTNTGLLENANVSVQRLSRKMTGKGERASKAKAGEPRKLVELPQNSPDLDDPDPIDFLKNVTEAKNLKDVYENKENIMALMTLTHQRRRKQISNKGISLTSLLQMYPHFKSFNGEIIEHEFRLLYPASTNLFLRSFFIDWVPKLLTVARKTPNLYPNCEHFADELLNAFIILAKFLPTPRRSYAHEARQPLHPSLSDLFHLIPVGSNPKQEASKRREEANYYVQPHIMAMGHPKALGKMFLVLGDGQLVELPRGATPTNAIDLLMKTYFALQLHYPLGWKNVFRFIQVHVFLIPLENPRESAFHDKEILLRNTPL